MISTTEMKFNTPPFTTVRSNTKFNETQWTCSFIIILLSQIKTNETGTAAGCLLITDKGRQSKQDPSSILAKKETEQFTENEKTKKDVMTEHKSMLFLSKLL